MDQIRTWARRVAALLLPPHLVPAPATANRAFPGLVLMSSDRENVDVERRQTGDGSDRERQRNYQFTLGGGGYRGRGGRGQLPIGDIVALLLRLPRPILLFLIVGACILGLVYVFFLAPNSPSSPISSGPVTPQPNGQPPVVTQPGASGFPNITVKPALQETTYNGCPPEGDGSDVDLNRRKNRVDVPQQYFSVALDTMVNLAYPDSIGTKQRRFWSSSAASQVAQYEGVPVAVEGYLANSKIEGPEATNCHSIDDVDFHIWIGPDASADRTRSLVVEFTPRVRSKHAGWTATKMERLDSAHPRVRISGWVLMDQEHPDQIGKTRGTLWEIHPVMQFEVQQGNQWIALDDVR